MKRKITRFTLLVFCVPFVSALLFSGCADSDAKQWKEFSSSNGNFALLMPGVPTEKKEVVETELGPTDYCSFILKARQGKYKPAYMISWTFYPPEKFKMGAQEMLEISWKNIDREFQNRTTYKKNISLNGFPGLEYQISRNNKTKSLITCRSYFINNRLYDLTTIMPKEQFERGDATKFLDSFRLLR